MQKINVTCPNCGTELEIVATAKETSNNVFAANTAASTQTPSSCKQSSATAKIEALRNAGVDVTNLFSMTGANGGEAVARLDNGTLSIVPDDDPIYMAILNSNTIPNRRLFRRWVMAQMFHMMTQIEWSNDKYQPMGFTEALNQKGFKYQWRMLVEELRVQAKLYKSDKENFVERNRWFNKSVVCEMAAQYYDIIHKIVDQLPVHKCVGVSYVKLGKNNIYLVDLQSKVFNPIESAYDRIRRSTTPQALYNAANYFHNLIKKILYRYNLPLNKAFKDAYKGAGAFFTLKNLILFHGCSFKSVDCYLNGAKNESMKILKSFIENEDIEGYKLFGILKEFLKANHIDIEKKQEEWRNKKSR